MNDFYRMLQILKSHPQQKFAMATIIDVIGSNYRRVGAKMLLSENGDMYGTLSAGCLEEDLAHLAQNVMKERKPHIVTYDLMSDDILSWGENIGCNGKITIYIEAIVWEQVAELESLIRDGKTIIAFKCIDGLQAGTALYTTEDPNMLDYEHFRNEYKSVIANLRNFLSTEQKAKFVFCEATHSRFLFERYHPRERVYVFGAGPDAEPIVSLSAQMDFDVTVIDPRENRCNKHYFPLAEQHIQTHPTTYLLNHRLAEDSYVLVMTHNFNWDRAVVEHIITHPVHFLGVLGPRRRTQALLPDHNLPEWVHSPIGLSIGADGPHEISVSIVSQLVQERNRQNSRRTMFPPDHEIHIK